MKKYLTKIFIAALYMVSFFSACSLNVSAEEISHITVLGDSISEGYGLEEGEKNYGEWLGEYYDADVSNYAYSGKTTQELINQLETDNEVINSVKEANLICVSIGGNDLLHFIFDDLFSAAQNYNSSNDSKGISPEAIEHMIMSISTAMGPAAVKAGENTGIIAGMLAELNSEAKLVFQTVYNPFEANNEDFKDMLPPLYTFASIYLASVNNPLIENNNILCADIKSKFKGLCPYFTNMNRLDIHPNKTGHIVIAEEIVQLLKIPGNYDIFNDTFGDMTDSGLNDLPQTLKNEVTLLSNGKFRIDEIPTETAAAKITEKITSAVTENSVDEVSVNKIIDPQPAADTSLTVTITILVPLLFFLLVSFVIFTAVIIGKKLKERRKRK